MTQKKKKKKKKKKTISTGLTAILFVRALIRRRLFSLHDASDVAFGGFSASLDGVMASGMVTSEDLGQSSTYRELKAIYYVLLSCAEQLR